MTDDWSAHTPGSFYEIYSPEKENALWIRFEFTTRRGTTPHHGILLSVRPNGDPDPWFPQPPGRSNYKYSPPKHRYLCSPEKK